MLKRANSIYAWNYVEYPADLCFFRGDKCWFMNIGHEQISGVIHPTKDDVAFLKNNHIQWIVEDGGDYVEKGLSVK